MFYDNTVSHVWLTELPRSQFVRVMHSLPHLYSPKCGSQTAPYPISYGKSFAYIQCRRSWQDAWLSTGTNLPVLYRLRYGCTITKDKHLKFRLIESKAVGMWSMKLRKLSHTVRRGKYVPIHVMKEQRKSGCLAPLTLNLNTWSK